MDRCPDKPLVIECLLDGKRKWITFRSARNCNYDLLRHKVEQCFVLNDVLYVIAWKDDYGDLTPIYTDDDLIETIHYFHAGDGDGDGASFADSILPGGNSGSRMIRIRAEVHMHYQPPLASLGSSLERNVDRNPSLIATSQVESETNASKVDSCFHVRHRVSPPQGSSSSNWDNGASSPGSFTSAVPPSKSKQKIDLWRFNSLIVFETGIHFDLGLLSDSRSLVHTGKLYHQPEDIGWGDWAELFVILFDNYVVMTKPKTNNRVTEYIVTQRPISLDLLASFKFDEPPIRGLTDAPRNRRIPNLPSHTVPNGSRTDSGGNLLYPFTLCHMGRSGRRCTLYAKSASVRTEWQSKLLEALNVGIVMESNKVFEMEALCSGTFIMPPDPGTLVVLPWSDTNTVRGEVTCSVRFTAHDGQKYTVIGCTEGLWIGCLHDPRSMRRVLHLQNVTQCAMLENFGLFLVLADKILLAYRIEALVSAQRNDLPVPVNSQCLDSNNKGVLFFTVGTVGNRALVIYMIKKESDSIFHALEPVAERTRKRSKAKADAGSQSLEEHESDCFQTYREFVLSSECYDIAFLDATVAITSRKGFEIVQMEKQVLFSLEATFRVLIARSLSSSVIPDILDHWVAERCESCRPLGMFRVNDEEFILCYSELGLYVNARGSLSRINPVVEWDGTADRVALHPPYILLFNPRFIEVRHINTGRLVQIIAGNDIRCTWDGRGANLSPAIVTSRALDDNISQEPRVHAVMKGMMEPWFHRGERPSRAAYQHVFQLVLTRPFRLLGRNASPLPGAQFQPSSAPSGSALSRTAESEGEQEEQHVQMEKTLETLSDILSKPEKRKALRELQDSRAQSVIDFLYFLLSHPDQLRSSAPWLRKHTFISLRKLSQASKLCPQCYVLKGIRYGVPEAGGGFCDIIKGYHDGQDICLKVVRLHQRSSAEKMFQIFAGEAIMWGQLDHHNILPFYGIYYLDEEQRQICLVSPWMDNGNIVGYLEENPHVPRKPFILDIINGLEYLHGEHIIHGDLKGVNILVSNSRRACIADFGLSTIRTNKTLGFTSTTGAFSGHTDRWAATELLEDDSRPSRASDVWALGCVCYEVLSRKLPFHECSKDVHVVRKLLQGDVPARPEVVVTSSPLDKIDDEMWRLMNRCWTSEPEDRPTCQRLLREFEPLGEHRERSTDPFLHESRRFRDAMRRKNADLLVNLDQIQQILEEVLTAGDISPAK